MLLLLFTMWVASACAEFNEWKSMLSSGLGIPACLFRAAADLSPTFSWIWIWMNRVVML
jgi:hypothetical protein